MFCAKCGKELFDEAVMCPSCGTMTSNFSVSSASVESVSSDTPQRVPDMKIAYHVGEIGEKFPLKLNSEQGDFYFDNDEIIIESFSPGSRIKTGSVRAPLSQASCKRVSSKLMMNKFDVLVVDVSGFVFSVITATGFIGKYTQAISPANDYEVTNEKLQRLENIIMYKR